MTILAHTGHGPGPNELLTSWNVDPISIGLLSILGGAYAMASRHSGQSPPPRDRLRFGLGLGATSIAIASPLDAMAETLASAHMVQHILLVMVAGPLFATSRPIATFMTGLPRSTRKLSGRLRRRLGLTPSRTTRLTHPLFVWLALAGSLWFWHAAGPYQLALENPIVHFVEHMMFLFAAVLFWSAVLRPHPRFGPGKGLRVMMTFAMAFQGVLLAALITFAPDPWYSAYAETAPAWNLAPLTDQQLAGLMMWIPSGLIYTGVGIGLVVSWIGDGAVPGDPQPH